MQSGTALSKSARRYSLAVLVVVYTFNFIDRQILAILLPAIKAEFLVDDWVLGFLVGTSFAVFYATLGMPISLLADRWNRRNLIAIALAIWSGMTALSGVAANVTQLALARIGVGIGEAGCSPPAHSMIADYYPPQQRATAMGIFTVGISAGILIAYLSGGWIAENLGWRMALLIVGLPGLALALVVRFTVTEPVRGSSEGRQDSDARYGVIAVARFLYSRKSFVHMSMGAALASFNAYAVLAFFPSFLIRSHGMNLLEIGMYIGVIIGVASAIGFVGGGYLADRVGSINSKYALWAIAGSALTAWRADECVPGDDIRTDTEPGSASHARRRVRHTIVHYQYHRYGARTTGCRDIKRHPVGQFRHGIDALQLAGNWRCDGTVGSIPLLRRRPAHRQRSRSRRQ
jgi:MFS family permease